MRPLKLDEDIRPLSEFRAQMASFVKHVNDTKRPLVLTQHGRGTVVVVDIAEYAAMRERLETIDDIAAARAQLAAGEGIAHDQAKAQALGKLALDACRLVTARHRPRGRYGPDPHGQARK